MVKSWNGKDKFKSKPPEAKTEPVKPVGIIPDDSTEQSGYAPAEYELFSDTVFDDEPEDTSPQSMKEHAYTLRTETNEAPVSAQNLHTFVNELNNPESTLIELKHNPKQERAHLHTIDEQESHTSKPKRNPLIPPGHAPRGQERLAAADAKIREVEARRKVYAKKQNSLTDIGAFGGNTPSLQVIDGRYKILDLIGEGGAGTVYRANDLRLHDMIALKMLRRDLLKDAKIQRRFIREVSLARRVTHRNVARTFDFGEHMGAPYLTMEYIDGESLGVLLKRDGALPFEEVVDLTCQICEGLAAAHEMGIIHRDLKPDNIMLTSDRKRVVITDFGIARATNSLEQTQSTHSIAVGTPAYMAPEQIEQKKDIDHRADVYALGAVLYELLEGKPAWEGNNPFEIMVQRFSGLPLGLQSNNKIVHSKKIHEIIIRCMKVNPEERYGHVLEVAQDLESALQSGKTPSQSSSVSSSSRLNRTRTKREVVTTPVLDMSRMRVAVMPFRARGLPGDEPLLDELHEEMIDTLSMDSRLILKARNAVLNLQKSDLSFEDIVDSLEVDYLVEGSLSAVTGGTALRLGVRLIAATDGSQLWATRAECPRELAFDLCNRMAEKIVHTLQFDDTRREQTVLSEDGAENYLEARYEMRKRWHASYKHFQEVLEMFEKALEEAPDDPLVLSDMATAYSRMAFYGTDTDHALLEKGKELALQAVKSSGELAVPFYALANVLFSQNKRLEAVQALRQGIDRQPSWARSYELLGRIFLESGSGGYNDSVIASVKGANRLLKRALRLEVKLNDARFDLMRGLAFVEEWQEVDALSTFAIEIPHERVLRNVVCARLDIWRGRSSLFLPDISKIEGNPYLHTLAQVAKSVLETKTFSGEWQQRLKDILPKAKSMRFRTLIYQFLAEFYAYTGQTQPTLTAIEQVARSGSVDLAWFDLCPLFKKYRTDASFVQSRNKVRSNVQAMFS